ncbi:MAG: DinB family protein [Tepidisphaeraceae bacterium]
MNAIELLVRELNGSAEWLKMTLADFTDADLMTRPAPAANHPMWQLGHLCAGEVMMMSMIKPGIMPELPAGFVEKFDKKTAGIDDAKQFGATKQQLLDLLTRIRGATVGFVKTLRPEDLDAPAPEKMRSFCPTVGDLIALQSSHIAMHMGQMQVARRKLGKPVLF